MCWNMDVTLKEPANIAASRPSGHNAWQNIFVFSYTLAFLQALSEDSTVLANSTSVNEIRALTFVWLWLSSEYLETFF